MDLPTSKPDARGGDGGIRQELAAGVKGRGQAGCRLDSERIVVPLFLKGFYSFFRKTFP